MNTKNVFLGLFLSVVAIGCSSAESDASTDEPELASCSRESYEAALAHYKAAVSASKARLENGACEAESGYLATIADAASRAVTTCGAFRATIKDSPWAAPLREALGPSLTLRSLTGELLVIKDSEFQNWNGTEELLARGVSFWASAQGAYGWPIQIDLRVNGDATWGFLHYDEQTEDISWRTTTARYEVTKQDEAVTGKRILKVTHDGVTDSFLLGVETPSQWQSAPVFTLSPLDAKQSTQEKLYSIPSECDA